MKTNQKFIIYLILGIILLVTGISQAANKDFLAVFPLFAAIVFFVQAYRDLKS